MRLHVGGIGAGRCPFFSPLKTMQKFNNYTSNGDNQTLEINVNSKKNAIIILWYNIALTIAKVADDFHCELPETMVYVYDNNSADDAARIAREARGNR